MIHTVKDFGIVNKAEIDVFLELSCFFDDPEDVGNLISGSSAFSKTSLNSGSSWFTYGLENFEHYSAVPVLLQPGALRVVITPLGCCPSGMGSSWLLPLTSDMG